MMRIALMSFNILQMTSNVAAMTLRIAAPSAVDFLPVDRVDRGAGSSVNQSPAGIAPSRRYPPRLLTNPVPNARRKAWLRLEASAKPWRWAAWLQSSAPASIACLASLSRTRR